MSDQPQSLAAALAELQQRTSLSAAVWTGFSALMFVTDPAHWPAFAAHAEQRTPGMTWDEQDRISMRRDAWILHALAEWSTPRDRD